jgi:signal transduction histidine kinase
MTETTTSLDQRTFKKLRRLYIIALTAVAVAVFISQVLIGKFLEEQEADSRLVNMSGRQRMLSQKLTKESLLLARTENPEARQQIKNEFSETLQLWTTSHDQLRNGNDSLGLPEKHSEKISAMFEDLQPYYENMVTASEEVIRKLEADPAIPSEEITSEIGTIRENEASFLLVMDSIVDEYDSRAFEKVTRLQNLEVFLTVFTLLILLGEFLIIFLPTAKAVKKNMRQLLQAERNAMKMAHDADELAAAKEKSVRQLRALGDAMDEILLFARIAQDGTILHMGEKFSRLFKVRQFTMEPKFSEVLSIQENEQLAIERILAEHKRSGWQGEIKATTRDKNHVWLEMAMVPFRSGEDKTELIIICVDITKNKEAQIKIEQLTKNSFEEKMRQQNVISRKIIENQENEQNRIAKDIHDGIGQMLTGLKYTLESIDLENPENTKTKITNLKELTSDIIQGVRTATFNLTPPELTDYGIVPALQKLTEELSHLTGKEIIFFNKTDFNSRLDTLIEINLYRITQEAINNAIKYAGSTHIIVTMTHSKELLSISIDDNGKGFDPDEINKDKSGKGRMGMTFMKERIKYINGRLFINSSPNEGTKVTMNIPLSES